MFQTIPHHRFLLPPVEHNNRVFAQFIQMHGLSDILRTNGNRRE